MATVKTSTRSGWLSHSLRKHGQGSQPVDNKMERSLRGRIKEKIPQPFGDLEEYFSI
jgi:hypothetical protein